MTVFRTAAAAPTPSGGRIRETPKFSRFSGLKTPRMLASGHLSDLKTPRMLSSGHLSDLKTPRMLPSGPLSGLKTHRMLPSTPLPDRATHRMLPSTPLPDRATPRMLASTPLLDREMAHFCYFYVILIHPARVPSNSPQTGEHSSSRHQPRLTPAGERRGPAWDFPVHSTNKNSLLLSRRRQRDAVPCCAA